MHFVRFTGDEYLRAIRVFGKPDFIHRHWDARAACEVCEGDVAVFAKGTEDDPVTPFAYDDSAYF